MGSETLRQSSTHTCLDPTVRASIEAVIGAPLEHLLITVEDVHGCVSHIVPAEQPPHISSDLARSSVDRLG